MSRLHNLPYALKQSFANHSVLKVIAGLNNFDKTLVTQVAKSASIGGADLVDIACDPELVRAVNEICDIPVCVSSIQPDSFLDAVKEGAKIIEIGNFDSFYPQGRFFDADEVLSLAVETRNLLPDIVLSVTVPHILPFDQQSKLALDLIAAGVDLIQTEGGTSAQPNKPGVIGLIEKAAPTLAATYTISQTIQENGFRVPVMCASGLSEITVPMAVASGASAIGVGTAINRLSTELEMIAMIRTLKAATNSTKTEVINYY